VNERPRRNGLQAWLVASFVAMGLIASLAVMLVVLPTLESSIRTEEARRAGADLIQQLRERQAFGSLTAQAEVERLATEIVGDVRLITLDEPFRTIYSATGRGFLPADSISAPGKYVADELGGVRYQAVNVGGRQVLQAAHIAQVDGVSAVIEAAAPIRGAEGQIAIFRRRVLFAVALVLILASLVGLAISRVLGARIRSLAGTAKTLAKGDLSARAEEMAPQELTSLGASLNSMAARLEGLVAETLNDRDRARALVASLAEGVLAVGEHGEVTIANTAAERLLGLPSGTESIHLDELPEPVRDAVRSGLGAGGAEGIVEVTLPGGIEALLNVSPLARGGGVVLTMRDVTEERRLARARRDLIANVSHELKTPLTAIKGFMELLEDADMAPERRTEFLDLMSQEVARLERLVAEQLELARLDAGALVLEREPVDLGELASEVAASRRLLAEREGVTLVAAPTATTVMVDADAARVEQILLILLDNAIRQTPSGGKISLGVSCDGSDGTLSVRDTGTGIPLDAQQFVFDRFYQADPSREGQGLGLGLAIARGLADAHGGSIEVRSAPLVGTVFTVRLPLAAPARREQPATR
jgi:signal transduction histidine kinase/HAMP domain-containing protein